MCFIKFFFNKTMMNIFHDVDDRHRQLSIYSSFILEFFRGNKNVSTICKPQFSRGWYVGLILEAFGVTYLRSKVEQQCKIKVDSQCMVYLLGSSMANLGKYTI